MFPGENSASLPINQGGPQTGVFSEPIYNLSVSDIDSFCFTERAFSLFAEDTSVLCAGLICPVEDSLLIALK